jgi:hypothetical protein
LLRTTGTGPLQSIWEEDARDILNDALMLPTIEAVAKPAVGYHVVVPRLLGELATLFPLGWAAAVLSISAAIVTALLALLVYVASGPHLRHPLARFLVSAPVITAPVAENFVAEVYNRPVCLHFFALYTVFWVLLWAPAGRRGRVVAVVTVGLTAFSTAIAVFLIPLALLRLAVRRDRSSAAMATLLIVAAALNTTVDGDRGDVAGFRLEPKWAAVHFVVWAVPNSILGFRATSDLVNITGDFHDVVARNVYLIALAWALIAVAVLAAAVAARRGWVRPAWGLALVAAGHSAVILCLMLMANRIVTQRYLVPAELLLFAALIALLRPARPTDWRKGAVMLSVFGAFLTAISVHNFRFDDTNRARAPRWTDQIAEAAARCRADPGLAHVVVRGGPQPHWSIVLVPCAELRKKIDCPTPACEFLDPPRASAVVRSDRCVPG